MRRSHAQEALNRTEYAEGMDILDHIKLLRTRKAAVDNLSSSIMSDETWRGIIIRSIPPTANWLPVIPSLYTMATSADIISTLSAHGMILARHTTTTSTVGANSSNIALVATQTTNSDSDSEGCTNPDCKAKIRSTHTTANCYWPGGGKEGQFPPDFGARSRASVATSNPEQTGHHFALSALARGWTTPGRSGILIGTLTDPTKTTSHTTSRQPTRNFIALPTPDKTSLVNHFTEPDLGNAINDGHHIKRELDIIDISDAPRRSTVRRTSASVGEQVLTPLTAITKTERPEPSEPITLPGLPTHETRFTDSTPPGNAEPDTTYIDSRPSVTINNPQVNISNRRNSGSGCHHSVNTVLLPAHGTRPLTPLTIITNHQIHHNISHFTNHDTPWSPSRVSEPLAHIVTDPGPSQASRIPADRHHDTGHHGHNQLEVIDIKPGTVTVDIAVISITTVITVKSQKAGLRRQSTENEQREIMGEPGEGEGQPSQDWATTDLKLPQTNSKSTINWSLTSYYYYARATSGDNFIQLQLIHPNCDVTPNLTVVSADIKPLLHLTSKSDRHHATQASAIHTELAENNKDYPTNHLPSPAISPLTTILLPTTHWHHFHRDRNSIGMGEYELHDNKAQKSKDMGEIQWRIPRERGNLGMDNNFVDKLYNPDPPHPVLSAAAPTYQRRHPPPLRLAAGAILFRYYYESDTLFDASRDPSHYRDHLSIIDFDIFHHHWHYRYTTKYNDLLFQFTVTIKLHCDHRNCATRSTPPCYFWTHPDSTGLTLNIQVQLDDTRCQ